MLGSGRHAAGVAEITILFTTAAPALCIGRDPFEVEYQLPAYQTGVFWLPNFDLKSTRKCAWIAYTAFMPAGNLSVVSDDQT
jgi:hypothetical protein